MARILKPLVRGGGWYPSKKWIPLVKNGGYTTQNGGDNVNWAKVSGVSPLSLPNALAHFINSLRQIGKCTVSGTDITCNNGVLKYGATGKNLFDLNNLNATGVTISDGVASGTAAVFNARFGGNGVPGLSFKENEQYSWSFDVRTDGNASTSGYGLVFTITYSDDTIKVIQIKNEQTSFERFSITSDSGKTVSKLKIGYNSQGSNVWYVKNIMLEAGSSVSPYEPYTEGFYTEGTPEEIRVTASGAEDQTATASNLFAVGSVKDEQDIISGTITRRCEAVVSDGTTPSGRYIGTVGEGNILVCAKETGYSGAIASFTADKAEPLSGLVAQINPVQDLHGQDAPYPPEGKGNLYPFQDKTATSNGVTAVFSGNHIKVTGTGTASGGRLNLVSANFALKAGTYYYKRFNVSLGGQQQTALYVQDGTNLVSPINDGTFTLSEDSSTINIGMNVESGKTYNYEFDIMLVSGSTEPSAFYPYSNICPISGWTGLSGQRTGVNLFDKANVSDVNGYFGTTILASSKHRVIYIPCKPNTTYTVSNPANNRKGLGYTTELPAVGVDVYGGAAGTITTGADAKYLVCYCYNENIDSVTYQDVLNAFQFELGSSVSPYEPYISEAISVSFGRTVYGGTDEVVSGNGTETMAMVDLGTLNWSYTADTSIFSFRLPNMKAPTTYEERKQGIISSIYPVSNNISINENMDDKSMLRFGGGIYIRDTSYSSAEDFKTAVTGQTLVYELATPTTFTHEGQSVDTLIGQNNVFVDTGNVTAYIPDFTTEQVAGQSLSTTEGTNTVFVTSNVDPVEIEVEYAVAPEE